MVQRGGDEGISHSEAGVLGQELCWVTQHWARLLCDQAGWGCNDGRGLNSASVQTVVRRTHISSHRVCGSEVQTQQIWDLHLWCAQAETEGSTGAMNSSGAQGHLLGSLVVSRIIPYRRRRWSSFLFTYLYIFTEEEWTCNVMLVSNMQKLIQLYMYIIFQNVFPCRLLKDIE